MNDPNPALPLIITAHQTACGTCAWCLAGHGWPDQRQLTRGPAWLRGHRGTHPTTPDPCTCHYKIGWFNPGGTGSGFVINPGCYHHGHHRHAHILARLRQVEHWDEYEATARRTLDDDELCDGYGE